MRARSNTKLRVDSIQAKLYNAIKNNDLDGLQNLIQEPRLNLNEAFDRSICIHDKTLLAFYNNNSVTALALATYHDHPLIIEELIKQGADPNQPIAGRFVLNFALDNEKNEAANSLINCPKTDLYMGHPWTSAPNREELPIGFEQTVFCRLFKYLGYSSVQPEGLCAGIAHMAKKAILLRQTEEFNERLIELYTIITNAEGTIERRFKHKKISLTLFEKKVAEEIKQVLNQDNEYISNYLKQKKEIITTLEQFEYSAEAYQEILNQSLVEKMRSHKNNIVYNKAKMEAKAQVGKANRTVFNARIIKNMENKVRKRADIFAFCDGILLHQEQNNTYDYLTTQPRKDQKNAYLYPKKTVDSPIQRTQRKDDLIEGDQLADIGGMDYYGRITGTYPNTESLINYFKLLRQQFLQIHRKNPFHHPIVFTLSNSVHAITLGYDPQKDQWHFIDANDMPIRTLSGKDPNTNDCLARRTAFAMTKCFLDKAIFTTSIYAANKDGANVKNSIYQLKEKKAWQDLHEITEEKKNLHHSINKERRLAKRESIPSLHSMAVDHGTQSIVHQTIQQNFKTDLKSFASTFAYTGTMFSLATIGITVTLLVLATAGVIAASVFTLGIAGAAAAAFFAVAALTIATAYPKLEKKRLLDRTEKRGRYYERPTLASTANMRKGLPAASVACAKAKKNHGIKCDDGNVREENDRSYFSSNDSSSEIDLGGSPISALRPGGNYRQ